MERQVPVRLRYLDVDLDCGYRIDMLVERQVVVELKVVERLAPVHVSQVLSYLRFADLQVGLLFNFNVDALAAALASRGRSNARTRFKLATALSPVSP